MDGFFCANLFFKKCVNSKNDFALHVLIINNITQLVEMRSVFVPLRPFVSFCYRDHIASLAS